MDATRIGLRRVGLRRVMALLALSACGCASVGGPPPPLPAVEVPPRWAQAPDASAAAAPLARWWQRFGDPQLETLVAEALQANTDIVTARAAVREARALRDEQAAALWPSLSGTASAQRSRPAGGVGGNLFQAGFDASWEPDVFGATRSATSAAESDLRASVASLADVQVSVCAEVALDYLTLRGDQSRLAIARDSLASQLETLQITEWRRQAGLTTSLEVEQQRAQVEQTRAQVPALEAAIVQARHALAVLGGRPPEALDAALVDEKAVPPIDEQLAAAFPADTLRQRADVRAAEQRVRAAEARAAQASAARLPVFSIGGTLGLAAASAGALGAGSTAASLLGSVTVPLFDAGLARARIDAQDAEVDKARQAYLAAVHGALRDVEDALVALRTTRERLAMLRGAAQAASNAALLARDRYASGLVDFPTVLDTQRTLLAAQDAVATAVTDYATGHVRLYKALGGGWDPSSAAEAADGLPGLHGRTTEPDRPVRPAPPAG